MNMRIQPIPWTAEEIDGPVPLRFERVASLLPEHPAIIEPGGTLTYDELNCRANAAAAIITAASLEHGSAVGILLGHGSAAVTAMLGVLKAGMIYSVLDPHLPEERLQYLVEDLQTGLLLTDADHAPLARRLAREKAEVVKMDDSGRTETPENPPLLSRGTDLAAVFYTSGSTGQPKGVGRKHGMVILGSHTDTLLRETIPDDRQSSLFGYGFGASVSDVFGALLTGSVLCPYDFREAGITGLTGWLESERISILHIPIALLRQWMSTLSGDRLIPDLRILHLGGNSITRQDIIRSRALFSPRCVIEHRLSTTETSNITRCYVDAGTPLPEHILPAGYPIDGKEILILDPEGRLLKKGETGEIAVRSRHLPDGYWRRPELSRSVFIADPEGGPARVYKTGDLGRLLAGGGLEHLGRMDHQIKIRGYRVELSEIEAVLLDQNGVAEAVVVAEERPEAEPRLIAYLSFRAGGPDLPALRESLGARLPEYMIPNILVPVESFPMTPTGKVDRKALPPPPRTRPQISAPYSRPETPLETSVAALWEDVLGLEGLGADDPFFELGGDSLSAARILQRADSEGLGKVSLGDFYSRPTISGTAALLDGTEPPSTPDRSLDQALKQLEDF